MASINDLTYTDTMALTKRPFLTDFRASLQSIEDYSNAQLKNNLVQLANDSLGTPYAFTDDGVQKFANSSLYNPIIAKSTYTGGTIVTNTTGSWLDVDASNVKIDFTPDKYTGDFEVTFQFTVFAVMGTGAKNCEIRFRLTDGGVVSDMIPYVNVVDAPDNSLFSVPITLSHIFEDLAGDALASVKLQYFAITMTNASASVGANTTVPLHMSARKT